MNYYKIKYANGQIIVDSASSTLELIRKYDLCTRENDSATIHQLEGEQLAIAIANDNE